MMKIILFSFMLNFIFLIFKVYKNYFLSLLILLMILLSLMFFNFNNYWFIYSNIGMDKISFLMYLMTLWIFFLVFKLSNLKNNLYYFILLILKFILILNFMMMNLFMFYLFFEISLIPIYFLVMGWGYQPERLKASYYMLFYTLLFSLPLLYMLYEIFFFSKSMFFFLISEINDLNLSNLMMFLMIFMAFMVKLPVFLFHNWLPKAHVEAPLVGSMILAAVMLKLGGYGFYRLINLIKESFMIFIDLFMSMGLVGMVYLSMLCFRHYDMKVIVAYSSVVHMGMMLIGFFMMKTWSFWGSLFLMFSHGLCSSGMFYGVNLFYERSKSRSMIINKGLIYFFPSMMLLWFLMCMNNMASPISLNLLSEVMIISVILNWSMNIIMVLIFGMFFSALYNLYLFSFSFHGIYNNNLMKIFGSNIKEFYIMLFHFIPLNFLILKVNFMI